MTIFHNEGDRNVNPVVAAMKTPIPRMITFLSQFYLQLLQKDTIQQCTLCYRGRITI